jgi:hypothetical protein
MRRRPLSYAALLSAGLLLIVLGFWTGSYERQRDVRFGPLVDGGALPFHAANLESSQGGVWLQTISTSSAAAAASKTHVNLLGVSVTSGDVLVAQPSTYIHSVAVRIPYWSFAGVASILPLLWVRGVRRQRRRFRSGHCPGCGFDLRMTPDACPECGLVIVRETADEHESRGTFRHLDRAPL